MSQTITLNQSDFQKLINRISRLEKIVAAFIRSTPEPKYGSEAWWKWAHSKGLEDKEFGEYYSLKSTKDIEDFFNHLDNDDYLYNKFHHKGQKANA